MEPTACLRDILFYLKDGQNTEAEYLLTELAKWINSGGFLPSPNADDWRAILLALAEYASS